MMIQTKIGLAHTIVVQQLHAGAVHDDAAVLQHIGAIGELERGRHILLDQYHGEPTLIERANGTEEFLHDGRRQTEQGSRRTAY